MQKLTHQLITGRFVYVRITAPWKSKLDYKLIEKKDLKQIPFPKIITSYLKEKNVPLNLA